MRNDLGVICIRWGLKPSAIVECISSGLTVEDCADLVVEKLKSKEIVSDYIYSAVYSGGFPMGEVKDALLKVAKDETISLRKAFNYLGGR